MRRSVTHFAGNILPVLSGLVSAPLTARSLGVDGRGQLTLIMLVSLAVSALASLGLGWVARADVATDTGLARQWNRLGLKVSVCFLPLSAALAAGLALLMHLALDEFIALSALVIISSLSAVRGITSNILLALGRNDLYGRSNIAMTVSVVSLIVGAFYCGALTVATALWATTIGIIIQMLFLAIATNWEIGRQLPRSALKSIAPLRLSAVLPRSAQSLLSQSSEVLVGRSDVLLVGLQRSTSQLGLYSIAALIPQIGYQFFVTLVQQSYSRNPQLALTRRTTLLCVACVTVAMTLAILAYPASFLLVPILFGSEYYKSLEYIFPACAVLIGLAALAPVLNDVALRRKSMPPFMLGLMVGLICSLSLGFVFGEIAGLYSLGAVFALLGIGYVLAINGGNVSWLRLRDITQLVRA